MNAHSFSPGLLFGALKNAASSFIEDNALRLSAALAYYSIFSIAPLIVLAIGIAGLFLDQQAVSGQLDDQMKGMIGEQGAGAIQSMVQSASKPGTGAMATIVGVVTLLVGASSLFGQLKDALNTIWEVKQKAGLGVWGFIRERLLSFGMVLMIGFLLLVSLMLTAFLSAFNKWIEGALSMPAWFWGTIGFLISFGVVVVLFAMIFKVLPDVEIAWKHVWVGAIATALLFEIGKFLLGWYLGRPSTSSSFGAAGSVVLLLLWVYYASCILLFGAEFTQAYAVASGAELKPSAIAEPVTAEARAQQGMPPAKAVSATAGAPSSGSAGAKPAPPREFPRVILSVPPPKPKTTPPFPSKIDEVPAYLRDHPTAGLAAALAGGFAVGLISRLSERKQVEATPAEQLKAGSRGLALAALLLLSRGVRNLCKVGYRAVTSAPVQKARQRVREAMPAIVFLVFAASASGAEKARDRAQLEQATRLQIFLDQANFGPGKIDGRDGEFTRRALALYRKAHGQPDSAAPNPKAGIDTSGLDLGSVAEVFTTYTISKEDVASIGEVPKGPEAQSKVKHLPYTSIAEAIAEKFHCDVDFLKELNPNVELKEGASVTVPNVSPFEVTAVKAIQPGSAASNADPATEGDPTGAPAAPLNLYISTKDNMLQVRQSGKLRAAFPVTIGSGQTESPLGEFKVKGVARMPDFRWDKTMLEKGERSSDAHILPPGPNNPVGVVWIALNKPGIGIHGTDDPDSIGRSASHGCIRLANWDVARVAAMVKTGVPVTIE